MYTWLIPTSSVCSQAGPGRHSLFLDSYIAIPMLELNGNSHTRRINSYQEGYHLSHCHQSIFKCFSFSHCRRYPDVAWYEFHSMCVYVRESYCLHFFFILLSVSYVYMYICWYSLYMYSIFSLYVFWTYCLQHASFLRLIERSWKPILTQTSDSAILTPSWPA